jgi:hypothetical protein
MLAILVSQDAFAAPRTILVLNSQPGDLLLNGLQRTYGLEDGTFSVRKIADDLDDDGELIEVRFNTPDHRHAVEMSFKWRRGQAFAVGQYEDAQRWPFQSPARPGMWVTVDYGGCNMLTGRFLVSDLRFGPGGVIQRLAIDFEQHCIDLLSCGFAPCPPLYGSIRYRSGVSIRPRVSVSDTAVLKGNAGTSDGRVILSLSMPSATPVTARFKTVDDTAVQGSHYVARTGEVTFPPGSTALAVDIPILGNRRKTGNKSFGVELLQDGPLIGDGSGKILILDPNVPMTVLTINSEPGEGDKRRDYVGQGLTWLITAEDTAFTLTRDSFSRKGVTIETDSTASRGHWHSSLWRDRWRIDMGAAGNKELVPGNYENAKRYGPSISPRRLPGLDVTGGSRGCNTLTGRFVVNQVEYADSGEVEKLSADFAQDCGSKPAIAGLFGAFRLHAVLRQASVTNARIRRSYAIFTVTLNPASTSTETVKFSTHDGTAQAGVDYDAVEQTITFDPGVTKATVRVPILSGARNGTQFFGTLTATTTPLWINVGSARIE